MAPNRCRLPAMSQGKGFRHRISFEFSFVACVVPGSVREFASVDSRSSRLRGLEHILIVVWKCDGGGSEDSLSPCSLGRHRLKRRAASSPSYGRRLKKNAWALASGERTLESAAVKNLGMGNPSVSMRPRFRGYITRSAGISPIQS